MATINPHTTRATGTILTAAIYNADHQNHITNANNLNADLIGLDTDIIDTNARIDAIEVDTMIDAISGMLQIPVNQDYRLVVKAPFAGTINETITRCVSGTATATWKVDAAVLGATNAVSSSEVTSAQSSNNTFTAGQDIILTISAASACVDMSFTIKYTRPVF